MYNVILIILFLAYIGVSIWSLVSHLKYSSRVETVIDEDNKILDILSDALSRQRETIAEIHNIVLQIEDMEKSLFGEVIKDEDRRG